MEVFIFIHILFYIWHSLPSFGTFTYLFDYYYYYHLNISKINYRVEGILVLFIGLRAHLSHTYIWYRMTCWVHAWEPCFGFLSTAVLKPLAGVCCSMILFWWRIHIAVFIDCLKLITCRLISPLILTIVIFGTVLQGRKKKQEEKNLEQNSAKVQGGMNIISLVISMITMLYLIIFQ